MPVLSGYHKFTSSCVIADKEVFFYKHHNESGQVQQLLLPSLLPCLIEQIGSLLLHADQKLGCKVSCCALVMLTDLQSKKLHSADLYY